MNCNLRISRERRIGYSARNIRIHLDGSVVSNLGNGKTVSFDIAPGNHNIGFAIGKTIVTEMDFQIDAGKGQINIICWIEADGGVTLRLTDYNIPHTISERNTLSKTANKAVLGTLAVIFTLFAIGLVFTYLFLRRYLL